MHDEVGMQKTPLGSAAVSAVASMRYSLEPRPKSSGMCLGLESHIAHIPPNLSLARSLLCPAPDDSYPTNMVIGNAHEP